MKQVLKKGERKKKQLELGQGLRNNASVVPENRVGCGRLGKMMAEESSRLQIMQGRVKEFS